MEQFTSEELNTITGRLRHALNSFPVKVTLAEPNQVWILLPAKPLFSSHREMTEFARHSIMSAGIKLHLDLHMVFMQGEEYISTVILDGTPEPEIT
ncbi:hypothetical protein [Pedobacter psychrodurus]|uniref:hypothetical protein n=1 Tax=Pedobacter psychrodurus TaxID=2530456 RepID=UPI002930F85A|nr:hypothetical protein [Pedobacter psychrodurus]